MLLAMLVLLQHGLVLLPSAWREVFYTLELGAVAVTAFLALSGFIVAEAVMNFYMDRPVAFLANRTLRIVPPYLVMLAVMVALDSWLFAIGRLVALDAPLQGSPVQLRVLLAGVLEILPGFSARRISGQDFSFIPFAWTLRVEFAFYVAASATILVMHGRQRLVVGAAISAAYLAFAVFAWHDRSGLAQAGAMQVLCVPFFAFGLGVFFCLHRPGIASLANLAMVSAVVPLAFTYWGQRGHPALALQLPLLAVLFAMLAGLARISEMPLRWREWDRRLGELSYPLYIGHGAALTALAGFSTRRGALPYCAAIGLSLLLAWMLHAAVEKPLRGLRTRLRGAWI